MRCLAEKLRLAVGAESFPDFEINRVFLPWCGNLSIQSAFDKTFDPFLDCLFPHLIATKCAGQVAYDFLNIWGDCRNRCIERHFNKILGAVIDREMTG